MPPSSFLLYIDERKIQLPLFTINKQDLVDITEMLNMLPMPMKKLPYLLLLLSFAAPAKQLMFNKKLVTGDYQFSYEWLNDKGMQQELSFNLDAGTVNNNYRHFKALRPSLLHMYSVRKLKQAAAQLDPKKGSVTIYSRVNRVEYEIRSIEQAWINEQSQKLAMLYETSLSDYLHQEYYTEFSGFHRHSNTKIYKPDHVRFARESAQPLQPLIDQIRAKLPRATARGVAVFLLSWLQNIPYDTLESRAQSNGAGFVPPLRLIANNKGDCDSKVTLMASIMKAMFPRLKVALIYIPGHALIGMNVSHLAKDEKLEIEGLDYTLAEPVGPGLLPFAEISEQSRRYIASGNYQVELL